MKGFHSRGQGRTITADNQVLASIKLDPGIYIVFAKAFVSIQHPGDGNEIKARLFIGDHLGDEMEFGLFHTHGSFFFSVALNCAVEFGDPLQAELRFNILAVGSPVVIDKPRLSAIQVSEIDVKEL